jgi:hypothetical protein
LLKIAYKALPDHGWFTGATITPHTVLHVFTLVMLVLALVLVLLLLLIASSSS